MNKLNEDFFVYTINNKDKIFFNEIKKNKAKVELLRVAIKNRDNEIESMKSSKFWKIRNFYLKLKYYFTFIFLNPRKFLKKYLKV